MEEESRHVRRVEGELRRREAEISQLERRLKSSQANERSSTAAQATAEEAAAQLVGEVRGAREEVAGKEAKLLALHKWARQRKPGSGRTSPVESAPDDAADSLLRELAATAVEFALIDESAVGLDSEGLAEALTVVLRNFASPDRPPALLPPSAAKQREANQVAASPTGSDRGREREAVLEAQVEALAESISDANAQLQEAAQRFAAKLDEASGAHLRTIAAQARILPTPDD
jgi:hypothetical protein